jgi:hypothetical protein
VTSVELSHQTCMALWFTAAWLQSQHAAGYLVQDLQTGEYRSSCLLPSDA